MTTRPRRLVWLLLVVVALGGVLAGCGDNGTADEEGVDAQDDELPTTTSDEAAPDTGDGASTVEITAVDIDFPEGDKEATASAGQVELVYTNEGEIEHTLTIEGREEDLFLEVPSQGDTDSGTIELDPGEYTYYCDVPGHREAGMEGTLTVEEA